jgi:MFS family permease
VGWLADKYDRRSVLIALSVAAIGSCVLTATYQSTDTVTILALAGLFGFTTFPIYSVAAAHAHDFASSDERVELSAALMFFYATGAIAAPYTAARLMDVFGAPALFVMIALGHAALVVFGLARMTARPTSATKTPYIYAPRTTFTIGRLMRGFREPKE